MLDLLPWIATAGGALGAAMLTASLPAPGPVECAERTLLVAVAPILLGELLGSLRRAGRPVGERAFLWFPLLAPVAAAGAIAAGRLPSLLASRFPEIPASLVAAAAEFVGFACVVSTLAGERRLYGRDARYEPPAARPRLRIAAVALAVPVACEGILDALYEIPAFRIYYDSFAAVQLAALAAIGVSLVFALPWLVRLAIPTKSLPPGPQRAAFEETARRLDVRVRDYRVARTGYQVSNAALLGGFGSRTVLLTDRLLGEHPLEELVAVVGHELGHARGRHMTVFGLLVFAFGAWALVLPESALAPLGTLGHLAVTAAIVAAFFRWVLGPVARLCEHDADVCGALTTGSHAPIQTSLERIAGPEHRWRGSWRHPSVASRVRFLERAASDAAVAARPSRILRRVRWICGIALTAGLSVFAYQRADDFPAERVAHAIRAGRYDSARAIARAHPSEGMKSWDRLAEIAASTGVAGPDTVLDRARAAFARGDHEKAALLARVAALRTGRARDTLFASVAEQVVAGDWPAVADSLDGPAAFLLRDPLLAVPVAALRDAAASRPASAPGNPSRRMGT